MSEKDAPKGQCRVAGAVPGTTAKGKSSWQKRDKLTERVLFFAIDDELKWREQTAAAEGRCPSCWGYGDVFESWSKMHGVKYRACDKCKGAGKPAEQAAAVA